jgi:c-di-GMP-binding flagellar brake protein YcgR
MEDPVNEHAEPASTAAPSRVLTQDTLPVGTPLEWPVVDISGALLFAAGGVVATAAERDFLFTHFHPQRGDLLDADTPSHPEAAHKNEDTTPLTLKEMHLEIGALIGVRSQVGSGAPMHPCRIIGFAPNHALFVTPPLQDGRKLELRAGENIEIVAIASHAVFRFVCTIEAICRVPFDYVVLSRPGVIRRLRERKSIRVRAHLPVRFGVEVSGKGAGAKENGEQGSDTYEGVGLAKSISALGMSLTAPATLGAVGERLRVAFRLKCAETDTEIKTTAVIRNVQKGNAPGEPSTHGLELDQLDTAQQMAMKVFVFDRQDDVLYWSNGLK